MSVADKLSYLNGTKEAIRQAIIDKGVDVLETDAFRAYADKIGDITSAPAEWEWPADWPDITSIVENDTDNTYPYKCIWLLNDDSPTFDYTFGTDVSKVLLSDGTTYNGNFADHVWGVNTDPSIVNYRWVILYMSSNNSFQKDSRPISITYNSAFLSGKTDFANMFYGCYSLQTIPLLDTSGGTDFSYMFYGCYPLQTIPLLDTSRGTRFHSMFQMCHSLQAIPLLDTSSGTMFMSMFDYCYSLQTIPLLDTSSGTDFVNMFGYCYSLQTIPQIDTSSGTRFSQMFQNCYSLQTIPLLDTSGGTGFSQMFYDCRSLHTIPLLDTSSGTSFLSMFYRCYSLQYIDATSPTSHIYNASVSFGGLKLLSKASIINIFNNLPTKTGQTITINTATDAKLTTEEKEIATDKGWTISVYD